MALDRTQIVNAALAKLGEDAIANFDEDSVAARLAKRTYDNMRDSVLMAHTWNFAIVRAALTASADAPVYEYDNYFPFPESPDKCLRVLDVESQDEWTGMWKVEGRRIITSLDAPLNIRYVSQVTNEGLWTPIFVEALSARLGAEWAIPLRDLTQLQRDMWRLYREKISEARSADGQEGMPDRIDADLWTNARWTGTT